MTATTLGVALAALDLITKRWAFAFLGPPPSQIYWIWDGFFGLETSINHGALFGIWQGQTKILAAVSVAALIAILCWLWLGKATESRLLTWALTLMLAGVLGNLYDRLGLWGEAGVRDWILFRYRTWTWPNFNIADSCLVVGAGIMLLYSFLDGRAQSQLAAQPPAEAAGSGTGTRNG